MKNLKKAVAIVALVALATIPTFRWNQVEGIQGNYKHSIAQSLQNQDIPTGEMVAGNLYHLITESEIYVAITK